MNVLTVKFAWQMVTSSKREGWRCVLVECGGVFVEMAGTRQMLILSVNSWTWGKEVRKELRAMEHMCIYNHMFIYHECYSEPTIYSNSEFGEGKGPIVLSNVECGGWETDIIQCSSKEHLTFSCPRNHTAGVLCRDCEYIQVVHINWECSHVCQKALTSQVLGLYSLLVYAYMTQNI